MLALTNQPLPGAIIAVRPDQTMAPFGGLAVTDPSHPDAFALQVTAWPRTLRHAVPGATRRRVVPLLRVRGVIPGGGPVNHALTEAAVSIPLGTDFWTTYSLCDWPAAQPSSMGAPA